MIPSVLRSSKMLSRLSFCRGISGMQSLLSNTNANHQNFEDDEKICEELISAARKFKVSKNEQDVTIHSQLMGTSVVHRLMYNLKCSEKQAKAILKENNAIELVKPSALKENIKNLYENGISSKHILDNSFLITMEKDILLKKLETLKSFKGTPFNDLIPLLQASPLILKRAVKIQANECHKIPNGNRINYFSDALKVDPGLVAKYFATHMFIFGVPFEMLEENLKTLQEYGIDSIHILRDLWVFKYVPQKLKERFEYVRASGRTNLRPWMVRCKADVLENTIQIYQQNKLLLGEDTIIEYLSKRLNYDTFTMKAIVAKHPSVLKCRVTKIKEVLDYLLDEAKYEPYEIGSVIRILTHSLDTTKRRLDELKSIGCKPSTLTIVCRSQNEYNKFIKEWIGNADRY